VTVGDKLGAEMGAMVMGRAGAAELCPLVAACNRSPPAPLAKASAAPTALPTDCRSVLQVAVPTTALGVPVGVPVPVGHAAAALRVAMARVAAAAAAAWIALWRSLA
jgi:hypothetical protein